MIIAEVKRVIQNGHEKYKRKNKEESNEPGSSKRRRLNPEIAEETELSGEKNLVYRKKVKNMTNTARNTYRFLAIETMDAGSVNATSPARDLRECTFTSGNVVSPGAADDVTGEQYLGGRVEASSNVASDDAAERLIASEFLDSPSQAALNTIISEFIDATSNEALKTVPCGSCARETEIKECNVIPLKDVPNRHHLIPHAAHPAHKLVHGLLVYAPALGSSETLNICNEC